MTNQWKTTLSFMMGPLPNKPINANGLYGLPMDVAMSDIIRQINTTLDSLSDRLRALEERIELFEDENV